MCIRDRLLASLRNISKYFIRASGITISLNDVADFGEEITIFVFLLPLMELIRWTVPVSYTHLIHNALGTAEFRVQRERLIATDAEPLRLFLVAVHRLHALNALLFEIGVEIAVTKICPAVGKNSNVAPFGMVRDMRRL